MRRDTLIAFLLVLGIHVGVAMVPKTTAKRAVVEDDGPLIKIVIPPLPPPDEPEKEQEQTDTPIVAPPALADIPTTVPVDAFVTPVEPPPPSSLNLGNVNINVQRANLKNVKIFDLADLDQVPAARFQAQPQYPPEMRINGTTGTVHVGFICDAEGHVQEAHVVSSSGSNELDQAAITAVSKWIFKPGRKGGHAVNTRMEVPIAFDLNGDS
ncbi:MAG TPA: energy transducer TonB [Opitutaceae bacterium]|jgi:protein TonB|nr:energy transducer TonB [Opitutaceae bacterium]